MPLSPRAEGLFFADQALARVQANRDDPAIAQSFALLDSQPDNTLEAAYLAALRYRVEGDAAAGDLALAALSAGDILSHSDADLAAIKRALGACGVAALLVDHPAAQSQLAGISDAIRSRVELLSQRAPDDLLCRLWLAALTMATGVLLDSDAQRNSAANVYRHAVDRHIHPEGYLKGIADQERAGDSYEAQLSATCALFVIAQLAERSDLDLWAYDNRGVTPITAAAYTYYYYYFPDKWRWEPQLSRERAQASMRAEGAFMELTNQRYPLHGIEQLFAEQRPFFCPWGGGLTTLTHSLKPARKRRWRPW